MYNPTRRNRNIGTAKQGHGQNNKLTIPEPMSIPRFFTERLDRYSKIKKVINDHEFIFVLEETREGCVHACSVNDVAEIINHIPVKYYEDLKFIIFRQPKRKEEIISPAWGRLIYVYEFEDKFEPAIILEACDCSQKFKWNRKLSPDRQKELARLRDDGVDITEDKRSYTFELTADTLRNIQLYRTLPHEFGHYAHYLEMVEFPGTDYEEHEEWTKRLDAYHEIVVSEKECYAHSFADSFRKDLRNKGVIPFDRMD